jgi:hypothetical protein
VGETKQDTLPPALETRVPKWLRITMYTIAAGVGLAGALLNYSKPVTMGVAIVIMLAIEGFNYVAKRRDSRDA